MKPIQGRSLQTIGFPASDGGAKEPAYIQTPSSTETPKPSEAPSSYAAQKAETKLQGNLRAAELNSVYQHNQTDLEFLRSKKTGSENNLEASKIEYPNIVFAKDQKSVDE
jgi:hypothetical protein